MYMSQRGLKLIHDDRVSARLVSAEERHMIQVARLQRAAEGREQRAPRIVRTLAGALSSVVSQ
jgi:hypothetical protein